MKDLRSARRLLKMWHRREKATIDHLVRATGGAEDAPHPAHSVHSAFTATGLAIEDQIRKTWRPGPTGLAIF